MFQTRVRLSSAADLCVTVHRSASCWRLAARGPCGPNFFFPTTRCFAPWCVSALVPPTPCAAERSS